MEKQPFVSVLIPTMDRGIIVDLLQGLFSQTYNNFEIIVLDQSTSAIREKDDFIQSNLHRLRYFRLTSRGVTRSKNFILPQVQGDIVLFLDDDIVPFPELLKRHVEAYSNPETGAVVGGKIEPGVRPEPILPIGKITMFGRPITNFHSTIRAYIQTAGGGNFSVRGDVIKQVGFFDTRFLGGAAIMEEADYSFRIRKLGYKILFEPSAAVEHRHLINANTSLLVKQRRQWYFQYFHNLMLFFLKNMKRVCLPLMTGTCLLISIRQVVLFTHRMSDIPFLMKALWQGFLSYRREVHER